MTRPAGTWSSEAKLVDAAIAEASLFANDARRFGLDSAAMQAWADHGGNLRSMAAVVENDTANDEVDAYVHQWIRLDGQHDDRNGNRAIV